MVVVVSFQIEAPTFIEKEKASGQQKEMKWRINNSSLNCKDN